MDSKDPKISPEKYAEMIREAKKRRDVSQGRTIPEPVGKWLESRGIDADTLLRLEPLLKKYDSLSDEQKKRFLELKDFEPNPGKATLTQVGETQTYLGGGNHGLPIYQEDVDMIKKSTPLAKKLVEIQKTKSQEPADEYNTLRTLRDTIDEVYDANPEELNTGPDTTENIHEIAPDEIPDNVKRVPGIVKQAIQKSRGTKENEETPDVMWYFDPESERFKPAVNLETQGLKFEPREQWEEYYRKKKTPEIAIDDKMYPNKETIDKAAEEYNKSVSYPQDYSSILRRMDDTHTRKNSDYGDAAYKGYKKYGDYYFLVQLNNKLSRLESLTIENKTQLVKDESIDDTLLDLANYAVMYLESRHRND